MAQAMKVSASDFSRGFGRYQDDAFSTDVIEVTSHGRVIGGYINKHELENFRRFKQHERKTVLFSEFDETMLEDLKNTKWGVVAE